MRPRCCFRNLTFLGINIAASPTSTGLDGQDWRDRLDGKDAPGAPVHPGRSRYPARPILSLPLILPVLPCTATRVRALVAVRARDTLPRDRAEAPDARP